MSRSSLPPTVDLQGELTEERSRVRLVTVHLSPLDRLQVHRLQVRRQTAGDKGGMSVLFAILGMLIAAPEAYVWLFRANTYASPNVITIGLPVVIAVGIFKRPAHERGAI